MAGELTARQRELLLFIEDHVRTYGFPPSIREMADAMGIRSTNGVNDHLKAIERKGYIARGQGLKSRAISVRVPAPATAGEHPGADEELDEPVLAVPILGRVAAGAPVLSEENFEGTVRVGQSLLGPERNLFALRVRGDSMIGKGIFEGDIVFVRPQRNARSGQTVVALVDGETTVKTFRPSGDAIRLEPANPAVRPIVIRKKDRLPTTILGVVRGVYRSM